MTTDLSNKSVEQAFAEWEGTEETYRWNMRRASACHGTPDDSYPFSSGWKAAETEFARRLEEAQQRNAAHDAKVAAEAKAEALEESSREFDAESMYIDGHVVEYSPKYVAAILSDKAAEYRAKATEAGGKE